MPFRRQNGGGDLCAIFVHAGAGFHSVQNEKLHLGAVNDAAKVAMAILKNGGDALDAVEMAIRLLEDREITNAGYGSNLTIDGFVECDATMVDHLGRSEIKNPIALARFVLEASSRPLSLQRVPPNLVVGSGATEFAAENNFPILPQEYLVSKSARVRWLAWKKDLLEAEARENGYSKSDAKKIAESKATTVIQGPQAMTPPLQNSVLAQESSLPAFHSTTPPTVPPTVMGTESSLRHEPDHMTISPHAISPSSYHEYARVADKWIPNDTDCDVGIDDSLCEFTSPAKRQRLDGATGNHEHTSSSSSSAEVIVDPPLDVPILEHRDDLITDTVGAIAVDCFGNIAAGSSSGGIGMKHRGRCGPAALVGIGTAVIPVDPDDPDKVCVATVTSGTGEHMATTSAAATAADRIYHGMRKDGCKLKSCNEDEALHSMIRNDFMRHPGVRDQPCVGAIGILAVKKTRNGIYFYFGHNTDSFAIASMHSDERKPVCTMSRSKGNGAISQGGRAARNTKAKH